MLLATMAVMSSCMSSNDSTTTTYSDAAITSFTLGTLTRYLHTTSKSGGDSIYKRTITGSSYKFHIDQNLRLIYNTDSLPVGTSVSKVLCTIGSKNYGTILIQDEADENSMTFYSATDSIDFTNPRKFLVYSNDNTGNYSEYTVKVNVHKEEAGEFVWNQLDVSEELKELDDLEAYFWAGTMYLMGTVGENTKIYEVDKNGKLIHNEEIKNTLPPGIKRWIGSTSNEVYALSTDDKLMVSKDALHTWQQDQLDDDEDLIPVRDIAFVSYPLEYATNTEYALIVGNRDKDKYPDDDIAMVWRKIVDNDEYTPEGRWTYMDHAANNHYALPNLENLSLVAYDDGILAIGAAKEKGDDWEPYTKIYQSRDDGITWKYNTSYQLPDDFDSSTTSVAMAVDSDMNLWLFCGKTGEVWRGRLNKLGWEIQD